MVTVSSRIRILTSTGSEWKNSKHYEYNNIHLYFIVVSALSIYLIHVSCKIFIVHSVKTYSLRSALQRFCKGGSKCKQIREMRRRKYKLKSSSFSLCAIKKQEFKESSQSCRSKRKYESRQSTHLQIFLSILVDLRKRLVENHQPCPSFDHLSSD